MTKEYVIRYLTEYNEAEKVAKERKKILVEAQRQHEQANNKIESLREKLKEVCESKSMHVKLSDGIIYDISFYGLDALSTSVKITEVKIDIIEKIK